MESIIRDVSAIEPDERCVYESLLGHALSENQRIIICVIERDREPDEITRQAALGRAVEIARRGRAAAAAQGITPEEADALIDEAVRQIRRTNQ